MKHALIVEDNPVICKVVEEGLTSLGFTSFERAWTEETAVAVAQQRNPDLVVVGVTLEGSGINAARRICEQREVPVLLVTAGIVQLEQLRSAGASPEGPFPLEELASVIEKATHARS